MAASRSSRSTGAASCPARAASPATRSANSRSAGSTGSAPKASASSSRILNIVWVPVVAFLDIAVPDRILTLPIIASFVVSVAHFVDALPAARARAARRQLLGSVFAAMSVQWTVARAVGFGLIKDHLPFVRTDKGGAASRKHRFPRVLGSGPGRLADRSARSTLVGTNIKEVREINIFAAVLLVQSLPFIAAVLLAGSSARGFNDFAIGARSRPARSAQFAARGAVARICCAHGASCRRVQQPTESALTAERNASRPFGLLAQPPAPSRPASPNTTSRRDRRRR